MPALPSGPAAAVDLSTAPPVRVPPACPTPTTPARDEDRRTVRSRLLRFIVENQRRRQTDASRGLRVNGAD